MEPVAIPKVKAKLSARALERCNKWLCSKYASTFLALISFVESVFAPIITDPFLIAYILTARTKWKWYVFIAVVASIFGGLFAYLLGAFFFETLGVKFIAFYNLEEQFASISRNLNNSGFVFVLLGAFTPIPYKLVALASGVLHINLVTFIVASIFGRALRLGLVGFAAYAVSPKVLPTIQKHLHLFAAVIGLLFLIYIVVSIVS